MFIERGLDVGLHSIGCRRSVVVNVGSLSFAWGYAGGRAAPAIAFRR